MKRFIRLSAALLLVGVAGVATTYTMGEASDHDDGEQDNKSRALNLTDHFTFVSTDPASPNDLTMIMYFNPRSLPGKEYFLSTNARYELHVSKVAARTDTPTASEDFVFRFEAAAPDDTTHEQALTLTVLKDGAVVGSPITGSTTSYANSKGNANLKIKEDVAGNIHAKFFVGPRADAFHFDVQRFFQVRAFLADRFFGGAGGDGNAAASLAPNCKGQAFGAGLTALGGTPEGDGDDVNLWNPPSCAPDFTKNYNVLAIVLNVPIADLGGGSLFDTWSTISVAD